MDVEGARSHGPGGRALSPEVGPLEEGVCPPELLMTCESSKAWQELISRIWNFSLKACFSGASESAPLVFQEPCEQVASIYCAAAERPVEWPSRGAGTPAHVGCSPRAARPFLALKVGIEAKVTGKTKEEFQEVRGPVIPHSGIRIPQ